MRRGNRHIEKVLLKRAKIFPVIGLMTTLGGSTSTQILETMKAPPTDRTRNEFT